MTHAKACTWTRERTSMYSFFLLWYADLDEYNHTMPNALFKLAQLYIRRIATRYQRQRVCQCLKLESLVACEMTHWNGLVFTLISATLHLFRTFLSRH